MIQLQRIDFHDGLQCPGICIKRFINESVKVCDIHILQCFYDLSCRKVCPISVKLYFQQTVDQQCCITEREVSDNSLFQAVIIGPAYKIVFVILKHSSILYLLELISSISCTDLS